MAAEPAALTKQAARLYARYGKPLESTHPGEYVAIFPDGRTVLGTSAHDVLDRALDTVGPGSFVFKLGEQAVWRLR
ncbi:MAG TPA: hypothetical protein VII06_23625 [Chloroflexota bacterium]|jgi:hypothetical protein